MDHRETGTRKRLIKVYRRDIVLSSAIIFVGLFIFVMVGYNGFMWIAKDYDYTLSIPLMQGSSATIIKACLVLLLETIILNFITVFIMRIKYIYCKIQKGICNAKMFRYNIVKEYNKRNL